MDLYRYFHPHHNPRLRNVPLRHQELSELETAARELQNAVRRALIRTESAPGSAVRPEYFQEILAALDFTVETLAAVAVSHPGDEREEFCKLLLERRDTPGWEHWSKFVLEKLASDSGD